MLNHVQETNSVRIDHQCTVAVTISEAESAEIPRVDMKKSSHKYSDASVM